MRRSFSVGLLVLAAGLVGLLESRPTAAQNPATPGDLVKEALKEWQTRPDLKKFADAVDAATPPAPVVPVIPPAVSSKDLPPNAKGYAIHVACEKVDSKHYKGVVGELPATLNDLAAWQKLSEKLGYTHLAGLSAGATNADARATRANFRTALETAAARANGENGDIVLITFSGHGSQMADAGPEPDEQDSLDETLCLFDGQLVDDELYVLLSAFKKGVRVVLILDSCHSETAFRGTQLNSRDFKEYKDEKAKAPQATPRAVIEGAPTLKKKIVPTVRAPGNPVQARALSREAALATFEANEDEYKKATAKFNDHPAVRNRRSLSASVLTIAGCLDAEKSLDLGRNGNGLLTRESLAILKNGEFGKLDGEDYNEFEKRVKVAVSTKAPLLGTDEEDGLPYRQTPKMTPDGALPSFAAQPFLRINKK